METIHEIISGSVSGGFFKFVGYWIMTFLILGIPARLLAALLSITLKYHNINKHGFTNDDNKINKKD